MLEFKENVNVYESLKYEDIYFTKKYTSEDNLKCEPKRSDFRRYELNLPKTFRGNKSKAKVENQQSEIRI